MGRRAIESKDTQIYSLYYIRKYVPQFTGGRASTLHPTRTPHRPDPAPVNTPHPTPNAKPTDTIHTTPALEHAPPRRTQYEECGSTQQHAERRMRQHAERRTRQYPPPNDPRASPVTLKATPVTLRGCRPHPLRRCRAC